MDGISDLATRTLLWTPVEFPCGLRCSYRHEFDRFDPGLGACVLPRWQWRAPVWHADHVKRKRGTSAKRCGSRG